MVNLSAADIAEITRGELVAGPEDAVVTRVAVDSRRVEPGAAFVAFRGERCDGHAYLAEAVSKGARALIVTRSDAEVLAELSSGRRHDVALVRVDDALGAVQRLGRHHRSRLTCPVLGITGSTGKTSTKDLLQSVLSQRLDVVATAENQNNELGVPLTILRAGPETEVVVVELAMRAQGQIRELCQLASPTLGLVTNVGETHMALLGSQEAIAWAKGELLESLPADGRAFLNGDDAWSRVMADRSAAPVTYYGMGEANEVWAEDVTVTEDGLPRFTIRSPRGAAAVTLPIPGRHNAYNAAAAAAVGLHLGLSLNDVVEGLETAKLSAMRMQLFTSASGVSVINDAYNANPTSMRAALHALADAPAEGRRIAVLGDMAELGSLSELAHFRLGEDAARMGLDALVTVGPKAERIAEGALAEGMAGERVRPCVTVDEASEVLDDLLERGDVVLVKASRVLGLERVVEGIVHPRM